MVELSLADRVCLVTGGSSGIGLSTARMLVQEGGAVMIVGRDPKRLERAIDRFPDGPGEVDSTALDLVEPGSARLALRAVEERFGGVDALVNCAGASTGGSVEEAPESAWWSQWELNVMATKRMMDAFAPAIAARGGGSIVNVCSSAGRRPSSRDAPYAVTKRAELALTEIYAQKLAGRSVRVNAIAPGPTATPLWLEEDGLLDQLAADRGIGRDEALAAAGSALPLERLAEPDEIAVAIVFQLAGGGVNGATWSVDGGHVPDVFP